MLEGNGVVHLKIVQYVT